MRKISVFALLAALVATTVSCDLTEEESRVLSTLFPGVSADMLDGRLRSITLDECHDVRARLTHPETHFDLRARRSVWARVRPHCLTARERCIRARLRCASDGCAGDLRRTSICAEACGAAALPSCEREAEAAHLAVESEG